MSKSDCELITELKAVLISQQYSPVVVGNYCAYARGFLDHLARRNILVTDVTEAQVERGHRSTASTAPYLKLATEDLRAIALDVPGAEVPA
ncbi:hypothetical protein [Mesorhizobium sp. M0213]|uniref:hypothetical protein n=1 Tax=Mesorhizobium sp. M0213 TaxID=2956917 RepID=UPI003335F23A